MLDSDLVLSQWIVNSGKYGKICCRLTVLYHSKDDQHHPPP